jgi:mannan endo-1,4-beta-mannosidase
MKNILYLIFVSLVLSSYSPVHKPQHSVRPVRVLKSTLKKISVKGYVFGHQDDTNYGHSWSYEKDRSDIKDVCGDYPGLIGFDLGHIELGDQKNLDGVPFNKIREEAVNQYLRGGIVTLSWHLNNPCNISKTSWDVGDSTIVKSILQGGNAHRQFQSWLKIVADFINSIKTPSGIRVPVIFRPWHENTGDWFWWGAKWCTPQQYKSLWSLTVRSLRAYGVNNVIYAYSPGGGITEQAYMERYPGDNYIDILGVDIYQYTSDNSVFQKDIRNSFDYISRIGKEHHKLIALTETGYQTIPESEWWTKVLMPAIDNYPICYVLLWRNAHDKPEHYYATFKGEKSADDFVKFYQSPKTFFAKDVQQIKSQTIQNK